MLPKIHRNSLFTMSRIVTLLSDFGTQDAYVGAMKGTIAQINPAQAVIDVTHDIEPQNIAQARFVLMNAFPYFPRGTVHVAVVDPGVGSARRGVAIVIGDSSTESIGVLVGPDNGLFGGILEQYPILAAVELNQFCYWRIPQPSHTFHGRDIFAPVGAHLANGVELDQVGTAIAPESLKRLALPPLVYTENEITGSIQAIDRFGNLVTTIPAAVVANQQWSVELEEYSLPGLTTYSDRSPGTPVALIGSHGWVEIAIVNGNAQQFFNLQIGDTIKIQTDEF